MSGIVAIDGEVFTAEDLVKHLKLNGRFDTIMEEVLQELLAVRSAKRSGVKLSDEEVQLRADQFRRVFGLHKARDTVEFFESMGVTLEDFESMIRNMLYQERVFQNVCSPDAIERYFKLNSPQFETLELSHIVLESEGAARELMSLLEEEPDSFRDMASEHSVADSREQGGVIGKLGRGLLDPDLEAKLFSAGEGDLVGPFSMDDGESFEIFRIDSKQTPQLDDGTRETIARTLREEWLTGIMDEHRIEIL